MFNHIPNFFNKGRDELEDENTLVKARIKFKGDEKYTSIAVTEQQYLNLLQIPIIEKCEALGNSSKPLTDTQKARFNERIMITCSEEPNYSKYLLK